MFEWRTFTVEDTNVDNDVWGVLADAGDKKVLDVPHVVGIKVGKIKGTIEISENWNFCNSVRLLRFTRTFADSEENFRLHCEL